MRQSITQLCVGSSGAAGVLGTMGQGQSRSVDDQFFLEESGVRVSCTLPPLLPPDEVCGVRGWPIDVEEAPCTLQITQGLLEQLDGKPRRAPRAAEGGGGATSQALRWGLPACVYPCSRWHPPGDANAAGPILQLGRAGCKLISGAQPRTAATPPPLSRLAPPPAGPKMPRWRRSRTAR